MGVELKEDSSPVTKADLEAEQKIRAALGACYPGEGILGEEQGSSGVADRRWVIDPIDGTKSFICGVPLYATLVSFEVETKPILGVAYFPALDRMLYAERGGGCFLNGRPCKVSSKSVVKGSILCCGSHGSMAKYGRSEGFMSLAKDALATRTWGDAFGHMLVATGQVEAMVDPVVKRWDISALQVIVEEAGGEMTAFDGSTNPIDQAVSTNGLVHEEVLSAFHA